MPATNGHANGSGGSTSYWDGATPPGLQGGDSGDKGDAAGIGDSTATVRYHGHSFTRQVDGTYLDDFDRELVRTAPGQWIIEDTPPFPPPETIVQWNDKPLGPIEWFLDEWIPIGQCTALSGTPGSRKSLWILQLMIAAALGEPYYCGRSVMSAPTLGLFCEDTQDEIRRRATRICEKYGRPVGDLGSLYCRSLVGVPHTELVYFTPSGRMLTTPAFTQLENDIGRLRPRLVALDVIPDFFAGDENRRHQVHAFIRLLDGLAQKYECAILYSHHPSLQGVRSKTLASGSTAWEGKVRCRITIEDPELTRSEDRASAKPSNNRIICRVKCNYAKPGEEIALSIDNHTFVLGEKREGEVETGQYRDLSCQSKFLDLLLQINAAGRWVNLTPNSKGFYAPAVFAQHPDHGNFTKREFEGAMNYLLGCSPPRIVLGNLTAQGRKHSALVINNNG